MWVSHAPSEGSVKYKCQDFILVYFLEAVGTISSRCLFYCLTRNRHRFCDISDVISKQPYYLVRTRMSQWPTLVLELLATRWPPSQLINFYSWDKHCNVTSVRSREVAARQSCTTTHQLDKIFFFTNSFICLLTEPWNILLVYRCKIKVRVRQGSLNIDLAKSLFLMRVSIKCSTCIRLFNSVILSVNFVLRTSCV